MVEDNMDTQYAAGFFDGEGSINISIQKNKPGYKNDAVEYRVQATQVTQKRDVLDGFAERWGGKVYDYDYSDRNPKRQPFSTWSLGGKGKILLFLRDVYPHMIVKKDEAAFMMLAVTGELAPSEAKALIQQDRKVR